VVNGNGTRGAAAAVGAYLGGQGWPQARFQNLRPYRVVSTVVEYREGFQAAAQALLQSLPPGTALRQAQTLGHRVDVRVVLGRDTATVALASCQMSGVASSCVPSREPQAGPATNSLALGETRLAPAVVQPR
jgi:LytR cell envelope-related transcriptional attenuator